MTLINYYTTLDKAKNKSLFIQMYGDKLFELYKKQHEQELVNGYSHVQYQAMVYKLAFIYCLNLLFLSLERLSNESYEESEKRQKELYDFSIIQSNMAHKGIDLDLIYNNLLITHIPIDINE
jgi:hypothetical protein